MVQYDKHLGRQQGTVTRWNDDRGFGFIEPASGGSRVFVHVSAFPRGRRPVDHCEVTYAVIRDDHHQVRAAGVQLVNAASGRGLDSKLWLSLGMAAFFFVALMGLTVLDELPIVILGAYVLLSSAALVMYRADKIAARRGQWRTPESTLHLVAVVGGWPGALVAQQAFRHKTTKQPFRFIFFVTVIVNWVALAWFVSAWPTFDSLITSVGTP